MLDRPQLNPQSGLKDTHDEAERGVHRPAQCPPEFHPCASTTRPMTSILRLHKFQTSTAPRAISKPLNQTSLVTQSISNRLHFEMQAPLTTGLGPQDHAHINRAASIPGKPTAPYISVAPITLPSPNRLVPLQLRLTAPATMAPGRTHPIILLSHGHGPSNNLSSLNGYAPTAQFYASHGFVVIQPTHLTSRTLEFPHYPPSAPVFWQFRVQDMVTILDQLDELERAVPFIQGRLDRERVVIWGHSMGSHTAAALLGMSPTPYPQESSLRDPRIKFGIILGALGEGVALTENVANTYPYMKTTDYSTLTTPTLVVAGDADESLYMNTRGWRWHAEAFEKGPGAGDLMVMHGGKHSFGGISGWDSSDCKLFEEESPEMCAAVLRGTLGWMRGRLYEGDESWEMVGKALEETGLGHVEKK